MQTEPKRISPTLQNPAEDSQNEAERELVIADRELHSESLSARHKRLTMLPALTSDQNTVKIVVDRDLG